MATILITITDRVDGAPAVHTDLPDFARNRPLTRGERLAIDLLSTAAYAGCAISAHAPRSSKGTVMSHIVTAHGAEYALAGAYLADNAISIDTIAHALAQINRFSGHAKRPYSVAEHSLLCADIAERMQLPPYAVMAALMHDAHEAYVGDMSSPAKQAVGPAWKDFEDVHARAVRRHFGLQTPFVTARAQIHSCDLVALATERRHLMVWDEGVSSSWPILDTPGRVVPVADWVDLCSLQREQRHWTEWRDMFLERFHALKAATTEWSKATLKELQS